MKQITIHSDGFYGKNSALITEEGELLDNVIEANISLQAGQVTAVELTMQGVATNLQAGVTQVVFDCQLCGFNHSHTCDSPNPAPAIPLAPSPHREATMRLFDFEVCGKTTTLSSAGQPAGLRSCYTNKALRHSTHWDAKYDYRWSTP